MNYKEVRAIFDDYSIRVYQAYNERIALEAIRLGRFGPSFKMSRMTWIKPSFLWMMYRCGWCEKENQEHVLAIDIKRDAFDYILNNHVLSTFDESVYKYYNTWRELSSKSDIICQWDPERDIYGNPLGYRSIQIGLRNKAVEKYVNDWIINIEDITNYVKELKTKRDNGEDIFELLPKEKIF